MKLTSSLLQKTIIAFILILLPIVISFSLDYYRNKEHLEKETLQKMTIVAEGVEGQVYQFLEMSKIRLHDFSTDGFIRDEIRKIINGDKQAVYSLNEHLLFEKKEIDETVDRIHIISLKGRVLAATDVMSIGRDVSHEDFFIKKREGISITESFKSEWGSPELVFTTVIKDRHTKEPIGVIANFILLSNLDKLLSGKLSSTFGAISSTLGRPETLDIYLVNKDNYMITGSTFIKDAVLKQKADTIPVQRCLSAGKELSGFYKDYRGVEVAGASMCIPSMQWTLLVEVDTSEGLAPLVVMRRSAVKSGFVVIGLILLVSLYIFRKVVMPLRKVYSASENIAGGNYDILIPVETNDEIGKVAFSINRMAKDIKDRTKLLIESEGQLKGIIDNSAAVIYLKDSEGRYILINKRYEELFHITKEDIKGKTDFDIFPDNIASSFRANDLEVLKSGRPIRFDEVVPHDDGIHYYISMKVPILDSNGVSFELCGISTDITERKRIEDEIDLLKSISMSIAKSGDFGSALTEVLASVCQFTGWLFGEAWFPDSDGAVLEYSKLCYCRELSMKRFCDLSIKYTFSKGEGLPGRVWLNMKPEWIRDVTADETVFLRHELAGDAGIKASLGVPIVAGDEVLAVLVFFMSEVRGEDSRLVDIIKTVAAQLGPIFQHRRAEDLRYELQQRYEALVNSLNVGIYRYSMDGTFIEVNHAMVTIYEAESMEELCNHNVSDLAYAKKQYQGLIDKITINGFIRNEAVECVTLKGRRIWVSVSAVLKKDEKDLHYIEGLIEDITEQKSLGDQLIQAQKMESIGRLAGGISHDFNNILTAVIGYGTIMIMKRGDDELIKKYTDNILTLCDKAANLTKGLLTFSRSNQMNIDIYNLNEIVRSSEKLLSMVLSEDIQVITNLYANELMVQVDFAQVEQVLMNLATNSRDAMPEGGTIIITTTLLNIDNKFISSHGLGSPGKPGNYALLSFTDTGIGIDETVKNKIFDPFFTTKEVGKGTGLGLSMVFGIIKQHNGFIEVNSEHGTGTTFNIYIPVTEMLNKNKIPLSYPINKENKLTILIAEDDEAVRSVTAATLREFGYNVIEAVDGEDAILKFMEHAESVGLLFFDIVMPQKNGLEAYEEIIKTKPGVKAVFTSGYTLDTEKVNKIQEYGAVFIPKPISPALLYKKVSEALSSFTHQN